MHFAYLAFIMFSMIGMVIVDHKYKLAIFYNSKRTALVLSIGVILFSIWDFLGIHLGIFYSGQSAYMSGIYLAPEYPLEELVFLLFLCYFTLILYRFGTKKWQPM